MWSGKIKGFREKKERRKREREKKKKKKRKKKKERKKKKRKKKKEKKEKKRKKEKKTSENSSKGNFEGISGELCLLLFGAQLNIHIGDTSGIGPGTSGEICEERGGREGRREGEGT